MRIGTKTCYAIFYGSNVIIDDNEDSGIAIRYEPLPIGISHIEDLQERITKAALFVQSQNLMKQKLWKIGKREGDQDLIDVKYLVE